MALSTPNSYGSTKYQALLLGWHINRYIHSYEQDNKINDRSVKSYVAEPGIVESDMFRAICS